MGRFDLVIFDMDGTLVDSERVFWPVMSSLLEANCGAVISCHDFEQRYGGHEIMRVISDLQARFDIDPESFMVALDDAYAALDTVLQPTVGAHETLNRLADKKRAVASNGSPDYVQDALTTAGLIGHFDAIFTHADVARPKPAPDVYIHTAIQLGVDPSRCIVLEDRVLGIESALAAGMTAIGFCGNAPKNRQLLLDTGVPVIEHFADFEEMVRQ